MLERPINIDRRKVRELLNRRVIASAPGRVCLAGEDIDWISGPAILCAINLRVSATVVALPAATDALILSSADPFFVERRVPLAEIGRYQHHPMDYVHAAVRTLV